jgi:hypothetical protein
MRSYGCGQWGSLGTSTSMVAATPAPGYFRSACASTSLARPALTSAHEGHLLAHLDVVVGDAAPAQRHQVPVPEVTDDLHLVGELLVPALDVGLQHLHGHYGPVTFASS